jgi:hypothetical protein
MVAAGPCEEVGYEPGFGVLGVVPAANAPHPYLPARHDGHVARLESCVIVRPWCMGRQTAVFPNYNVVWAVNQSVSVLTSPNATSFQKVRAHSSRASVSFFPCGGYLMPWLAIGAQPWLWGVHVLLF